MIIVSVWTIILIAILKNINLGNLDLNLNNSNTKYPKMQINFGD